MTPQESRIKAEHDYSLKLLLIRIAKKRAARKGIEFTLRPEDVVLVDTCPILGLSLVKGRGKLEPNSYSLDRVDSDKGYVKGNVRVISWRANMLKNNLTLEQAERLVSYMKGQL